MSCRDSLVSERNMNKILCSTGALIGRPNGRDYRLLPLAEQLSCDGLEFMMYSSWYEETKELLAVLADVPLPMPVMHCEKHIGEKISLGGEENIKEAFRLFEINCQIAESIQAEKLVIHLWDGMTSDRNFENNKRAYPQLAELAKAYGTDLLVENVVCSCKTPMEHLAELAEEYPEVHFVFDTKMAEFHRQLTLLYEEEYAWLWKDDHIRHYHVNDYAGGYLDWNSLRTLPIGSGQIDFERFFGYVRRTGYQETYTVEATAFRADGSVDIEMLNGQFRRIASFL